MKTKVNEIPLVGPKGRSELIKKINESNESIDNRFKVLEEALGIDLSSNIDKKYYQYFTIEATEDGTNVYFRQSLTAEGENIDPLTVEISLDLGENWQTVTAGSGDDETPGVLIAELGETEKLLIRGKNEAYGYYSENEGGEAIENCNFWADRPCYVYGNIMSLVGGDDFARLRKVKDYAFPYLFSHYDGNLDWSWVLSKEGEELLLPATTLAKDCYYSMFGGCTGLTVAPKLPATTLGESCYNSMFTNCTNLTSVSELPAITLTDYCYCYMFYGCTSLTSAPALPATTMKRGCYTNMFGKCTSLTTAPELPATTLAVNCYAFMFQGCTSLTTAPELHATTLMSSCYNSMFQDCSNLSYIKAMFTTTPGYMYTKDWVMNVKATGTFVKNSAATWNVVGIDGIPTSWTVQIADK